MTWHHPRPTRLLKFARSLIRKNAQCESLLTSSIGAERSNPREPLEGRSTACHNAYGIICQFCIAFSSSASQDTGGVLSLCVTSPSMYCVQHCLHRATLPVLVLRGTGSPCTMKCIPSPWLPLVSLLVRDEVSRKRSFEVNDSTRLSPSCWVDSERCRSSETLIPKMRPSIQPRTQKPTRSLQSMITIRAHSIHISLTVTPIPRHRQTAKQARIQTLMPTTAQIRRSRELS
jgi:hypothetical protein